MKLLQRLLLLALAAGLLTGMGSLGGGPEGTVPKVEENIRVKLTDQEGVVTELSQFSLDGKTSLAGTRGSAQVTVLFRNIVGADFSPVSGSDEVAVKIALKDGGSVELRLRQRLLFYGDTGYGAYQIKARDIRRIDVLPAS